MLERLKHAYIVWHGLYSKLPKVHRYTLALRIDMLLVECIEAAACAVFLEPNEKGPWIRLAIRKLETIAILLMVLWETGSLETKNYIELSSPLDETGKQLGGWYGQVMRKNERPHESGRSK